MRDTPRNLKLILAYDGTGYAGWQRQAATPTIQGVLEETITRMTGEQSVVHGAGRTDAGVHALGMVANFHTLTTIPCSGFLHGLNSMLPQDIRILSVSEVEPDFHARFSAIGKTYWYNFTPVEIVLPTDRLYWAHFRGPLDLAMMRQGLQQLIGKHDFLSFEASGSRDRTSKTGQGAIREIDAADLIIVDSEAMKYRIILRANGFLRHMVRNIIGTLVEAGQGKRDLANFLEVLGAKDRSAAGPTAPANGLFLQEVYY